MACQRLERSLIVFPKPPLQLIWPPNPRRCYATAPSPRAYKPSSRPAPKSTVPSKDKSAKLVTSSQTSPLPPTVSSSPAPAPVIHAPRLNPPATARAPPLDLPQRGDKPFFKYAWSVGKAYLAFYKAGGKGIIANYKLARGLSELNANPLFCSKKTIYVAAYQDRLSRAELQLLLRTRADIKVLPLFGIMFAICGEFTPLLVPFLTPIVPPTLRIPSQVHARREKADRRRQEARAQGPEEWRDIPSIWHLEPPSYQDQYLRGVLQRMAIELALYPQWWERVWPKGLYMMAVKARLGRRLSELKYDDLSMLRDGKVRQLEKEEVVLALDRRGIQVNGKAEQDLRNQLDQWLTDRDGEGTKRLLNWLQGLPVEGTEEKGQEKGD